MVSAHAAHSVIPVVDLFAGPGGLGEGFSSVRGPHGARFRIRLSVEMERDAHQTLTLRSFFRQFGERGVGVPEDYYEFLRGKVDLSSLYRKHPRETAEAQGIARNATLGDDNPVTVDGWIDSARDGREGWVLIGGPPCQAYSLAGRSRKYKNGRDDKHYLYEQYLKIISGHWPPVFVMENVAGLLSAVVAGERMFDRILRDLSNPAKAAGAPAGGRTHAYSIYSLVTGGKYGDDRHELGDFVVRAEDFGLPQSRHRIILLGVRDDLRRVVPKKLAAGNPVRVDHVLKGLPRLRSGLSDREDSASQWIRVLREARERRWLRSARRRAGEGVYERIIATLDALCAPRQDRGSEFVECDCGVDGLALADWYLDERMGGVCHHQTRAHMSSDLHRYLYAACFAQVRGTSPELSDFPADLLPDHVNVALALKGSYFADRFRVQRADRPSTTITSHISKDGHYYIHHDPLQCRSLTVREAARLQTFPDNYFFCGGRTSKYVQVGNAVPPYLARQIAEVVLDVVAQAGLTV